MTYAHTAPNRNQLITHKCIARAVALLCASLAMPYAAPLMAATTQIDNEPLATRPTVKAKPNLMVVLDDSGSMAWSFMPDSLADKYGDPYTDWYGYRTAQCNGVGYDPSMTYSPPVKYDGSSYPNAIPTSAKSNGYDSGSTAYDLSSSYYYTYSGTQTKMGWKYTDAGGKTPVNNTFYKECSSEVGDSPGKSVFTKVNVSSLSAADKTNYANWYSYYSKRYLLMRTAMGQAMSVLDDSYRVGFSTIHEGGFTSGGDYKFLDVKDFSGGAAGHKIDFYNSLYSTGPGGGTPLRASLANTGRYFAKKHSGQADPMQYSCQRNYALLTTDGYWNGDKGTQLDGTTDIGQQDGLEARPMRDSAITSDVITTVYTVTETRNKTVNVKRTYKLSRTSETISKTAVGSGTYKGKYKVTTIPQTYTGTQTQAVVTPQTRTYQLTKTVTTPEGGSPTTTTTTDTPTSWVDGVAGDPVLSPSDVVAAPSGGSLTNGSTSTSYVASAGTGTTTYTDYSLISISGPSAPVTTYSTATASSPVPNGDPTSTKITSGGHKDTLADAAQYYWATDLRTPALGNCTSSTSGETRDVCANIVPTNAQDPASYQHMNTFGIGLGVSGTLEYDKNYLTQTAGDFVDLKTGAKNWPAPKATGEGPTNIDDLWHASVNGRGQYYSALDASSLKAAIAGVIASIKETEGASSAAATSSLELIAGDSNRLYRASYTTGAWTGDITAYALTGSTATVSTTVAWSAQTLLDSKVYTERNIYFNNSGSLTKVTHGALSATQQAYFNNLCSKPLVATQCSTLSPSDKIEANKGENLVNYLLGNRVHEAPVTEGTTTAAPLYRERDHILGDIINGAPVYVGKPPFSYADAGYADFVATPRVSMIYAAANDGMLHAFEAGSGEEQWAFIPSAVMSNMYKLADNGYDTKHQYFVDGAPVMGDIKVGDVWKTIVVGGLNKGGKAYYALDITNPSSPKLLWEFTNSNLGLTFGNPVITKNAAGTWIVAFASGYNNETGDGKGRLFILNANTGAEIVSGGIPTAAGDTTTPSGLSKINAWIDDASNNTATRFYGGDLLGNVWRFDYDSLVEPKISALKLGIAQVGSTPQPITTKPMLIQASGKPVVIVGTGRYLGEDDLSDNGIQTVYAIKDPLTNDSWGTIRTNADFVKQTLTADDTAKTASITSNTVDWSTKAGWWVDLPHSKERVSTPMSLQLSTLVVPTSIPNGDACASGGASWLYFLNATNGSTINTNPVGTEQSDTTLIVGTNWVRDSDGNIRLIVQGSDGKIETKTPPVTGSGGTGTAHRTSWRELID